MIRGMAVILVVAFAFTANAEECAPQDYNEEDPPDFTCPGPEESVMVPMLSPPDAIPVYSGWRLVDRQGRTVHTLEWDGAVVHPHRLIQLGLALHGVRRLRWTDRVRLLDASEVLLAHAEESCAVRTELVEAEAAQLRGRLERSEARVDAAQAWYRSWWFGVVVGIVSTVVVVVLTAYALNAVGGD